MSILCVVNKLSYEQIELLVRTAQERALQFGVPMAIVYCAADRNELKKQLVRLKKIETKYIAFNMPLLTVIGGYDSAIAALKHHLRPILTFDAELIPVSVYHKLRSHPHDWPGTVIGVDELAAMQEITCKL